MTKERFTAHKILDYFDYDFDKSIDDQYHGFQSDVDNLVEIIAVEENVSIEEAKKIAVEEQKMYHKKANEIGVMVINEEDFRTLGEVKEVFQRWNKQVSHKGIFENTPYDIRIKSLTRGELNELKQEQSSTIYNQFLEILRHNVVSDKSNAFNKIFNLFLCKVLDEDKSDDTELDFQWIENQDSFETLFDRLNSLYKEGMKKFLGKEITDYNEEDITKINDASIAKILKELRYYKNQEFAFIEVYNKESFEENAHIVKEVVQLLQGWQIRYTHKQQFLGDFFELLLNTGFKQESGQYFTPVPLVRLIIQGLPLDQIIKEKIEENETDFLPYVIDFACGSGHFLTEMMDILQSSCIPQIDPSILSPSQNKKLHHYKAGDFEWAKDFIYGIEKDYRLVKTSKLSCFLHGDGEANIIHGSGIDSFNCKEYEGKLKLTQNKKENPVFDILVANPPYTVDGFRSTIKNGLQDFDIFKDISDNSSEIEVLFVERMKQLLKPKGWAAIVLPQSILYGQGTYAKSRKLILENFEIKSVIQLGGQAFMATGKHTIVLYLKKREKPIKLTTKSDYELNLDNDLMIISSGSKKDEKKFLGYDFSVRRNFEGIQKSKNGDGYLDDIRPILNKWNSFGICKADVNDEISKHLFVSNIKDCLQLASDNFDNSLLFRKKIQNKHNYPMLKIENNDLFTISIGNRVLSNEVFTDSTKGIPVYSANVFTPFGYINKQALVNYNLPSVIWGIDGDWMVNLIEKNSPFYPTDHCGIIQIKDIDINPVIFKWVLYRVGKVAGFSRTYRASIDRITKLLLPFPMKMEQEEILKKINPIEIEIKELQKKLDNNTNIFRANPKLEKKIDETLKILLGIE